LHNLFAFLVEVGLTDIILPVVGLITTSAYLFST